MSTLTEGRRPGEFIMNEDPGTRSREALVIAESQTIEPNSLLGKKAVVADVVATASADAANTASSGTIAMTAPEIGTKVKDGRYTGIATAATKVEWTDPDGKPIGVSTHGAAFTGGGIKFTITAGGTPNVQGDKFYVDVAADNEDFQYVAYDQDGTDGSETISGIAIYGVTTGAGETAKIAAIVRNAEVNGNSVAWPSDLTAAERANAEQALAALDIIVRN